MFSFLRNRSAEKDILHWLSKNGFSRQSAKFSEVELHAIRRPGWHQVFRFTVSASTADQPSLQLFGLMNSDERYGLLEIQVYEVESERDFQLATCSEGMITLRQHR